MNMEALEKISIHQIIWYIIPGLFLFTVLVLPMTIIKPKEILELIKVIGIFGILLIGILLGFLLEGLRLYRMRPGYKIIRKKFFEELQTKLNTEQDPYYLLDQIYSVAKDDNNNTIKFNHSIWIMLGHLSILMFLSCLLWIAVSLINIFLIKTFSLLGTPITELQFLCICYFVSILSLIIGVRIMRISIEEQKKCNNIYVELSQVYKDKIKIRLKEDVQL